MPQIRTDGRNGNVLDSSYRVVMIDFTLTRPIKCFLVKLSVNYDTTIYILPGETIIVRYTHNYIKLLRITIPENALFFVLVRIS